VEDRLEPGHVPAGLDERRQRAGLQRTRADGVEQQPNVEALRGLLGQHLDEGAADGVVSQNEQLGPELALGALRDLHQPGERGLARPQDPDGVADGRARQPVAADEPVGLGRLRQWDRLGFGEGAERDRGAPLLPSAQHEVERESDVGHEHDCQQPRQRRLRRAAVAPQQRRRRHGRQRRDHDDDEMGEQPGHGASAAGA